MKIDAPPFPYLGATSVVHIGGSGERSNNSLHSREIIEKGQKLMTMFGLWLLDNGYDEIYANKYSDPEVTAQRLRALDPSYFVLNGSEIAAVPISYFKDTTGEEPSMATDGTHEYQTREESLQRQLGTLAMISTEARENPQANAAGLRRRIVESINKHASHDDGQKEVVNGNHFSASSVATLAGRSDKYWLHRLLVAQDQARYDLVDATVGDNGRLFNGKKTTLADRFVYDMLNQESNSSELFSILLGADGCVVAAQLLFHGDMLKAYKNISAVAAMTGQAMPEGWRAFHGSTADFATIRDEVLVQAQPGIESYLTIADATFGGDMKKAYENISAVATMTGQAMPEGWQQFHGSTADFAIIRDNVLAQAQPGIAGYLAIADATFGGDMKKAYINISAVATMTGQAMPEGWQAFQGSTADFATIRDEVLVQAQSGIEGYLTIADTAFHGDMQKAYKNISAVTAMTGQAMPEGWQAFQGSTADLRAHAVWLSENSSAELEEYQAHFYPHEKPTSSDRRVKSQLNLAVVRQYVAEMQTTLTTV